MNVGATQISVQWDEIQRVARERNEIRQQALLKQYRQHAGNTTSSTEEVLPDPQQRDQRMVFTKGGKLQQNYIPKGTLFDKVA